MLTGRLLLVAAFATAVAACSSGSSSAAPSSVDAGDDGDDGGLGAPTVVHTYHPTFSAVYAEILQPSCALLFCHAATGGSQFLLMISKDGTYNAMVNVTSSGPKCGSSGLKIVEPGNPGSSLLYQKVTTPTCGDKMPPEYEPYLDSKETDQIQQWIMYGALNN